MTWRPAVLCLVLLVLLVGCNAGALPTPTAAMTSVARPQAANSASVAADVVLPRPLQPDPVVPVIIADKIGTATLTVTGAGFFSDWPFGNCPKPASDGSYVVTRVKLGSEHHLAGADLQLRGVFNGPDGATGGAFSRVPMLSLSWDGGRWSVYRVYATTAFGGGSPVHEEWLVFAFPNASVLADTTVRLAEPLPPFGQLVQETKEGAKTLGLSQADTEAWVRHADWLTSTYGPGTTFFGGLRHGLDWALVVTDPFTGQWGAARVPAIDPFNGVDTDAPCGSVTAIGTPSLGP